MTLAVLVIASAAWILANYLTGVVNR